VRGVTTRLMAGCTGVGGLRLVTMMVWRKCVE